MIKLFNVARWLCVLSGAALISSQCETRFEFSQPQMGVPFRIVLYAPDERAARDASEAAFARIEEMNGILSDYEFDSELSRLSRSSGSGTAVRISEELWPILIRSQELARRSDGAFDITVGPSVSLWRRARRKRELPAIDLLRKTRDRAGFLNLRLDAQKRSATLLLEGMRLDLGGIAKGYAVDQAMLILKKRGLTHALVAADGDIRVGDPPLGKTGWQIGLAALDVDAAPGSEIVLLSNAAISTSGDLSQRLEIEGKRYSHIVDPRTGIGLTDHSLVTVVAEDSMTADSLATTISVLGPKLGLELIQATPGTSVRILRQPDLTLETYESTGFRELISRSE